MINPRKLAKAIIPPAFVDRYRRYRLESALSPVAKSVRAQGHKGLPEYDCGPERAIELSLNWLCLAQDRSLTQDGGVARHYSLNSGWSPSYPETTGYIIPTFFTLSKRLDNPDIEERAKRMLDWLVRIQLDSGAFQGGVVTDTPVPVTFNTGQILIGLASGVFNDGHGAYFESMQRAATWLRDSLDDDGCWRKYGTPFAEPGDKVYETHVSWGLFEADRVCPNEGFGEAAMRQIRWAQTHVHENGWIDSCCLKYPDAPYTHTLGYALRGFVECFRWSNDQEYLELSEHIGRAIASCVEPNGFLPGRLNRKWESEEGWACLTGSVQVAGSLFDLYRWTKNEFYLAQALKLNSFVRRTIVEDAEMPDRSGAVAGSFPVDGEYGQWEYLNWAAKFMIDSQLAELDVDQPKGNPP